MKVKNNRKRTEHRPGGDACAALLAPPLRLARRAWHAARARWRC